MLRPEEPVEEIIRRLDLIPHPEGGYYRETFRDGSVPGRRSASTAIYYLLPGPEPTAWHRVDAAEVWHHYAGAPLVLSLAGPDETIHEVHLGSDLSAGERPQHTIPAHVWQRACCLGAWSLTGCTVAPGFDFSGFEMAPPGWSPPGRSR